MCRWIAYAGQPIYLESLVLTPEYSLIRQSLSAREGNTTNGDGFGIGWYGELPEPGLFKDTLPAWNDENLKSVSQHIRAAMLFAHVRASTGTATSRGNCHPFAWRQWMFMHNGKIGGFDRVRRDLMLAVTPALFGEIRGTTDSELFFYLMATHGLTEDPARAFALAAGVVLECMARARVSEPFRMTAALTNGELILALRYASDGNPPTLYHGRSEDGAGTLVLSEPIDDSAGRWHPVPPGHLLRVANGAVEVEPFQPATAPDGV